MLGELKVVKKEVRLIMEQKGLICPNKDDDEKKFIHCSLCTKPIIDRFLLKIYEKYFHECCLKCSFCFVPLKETCFARESSYYCKEHYSSLFGSRCEGCCLSISPSELVMKAIDKIYHVECFKCDECGDKLEKGDEFIMKDSKLFCRADFNVAEQRSDVEMFSSDESMSTTSPKTMDDKNQGNKRPRTILTSQQREDFKAAFEQTPKPCRKVREQLSSETGLSVRVVQVWFQNQRAKLKKLQRKSEDGNTNNKIKKVNNAGKVNAKKKRSKSTESNNNNKTPTSEISLQPEFTLPTSDISNETLTNFNNFLDISTSYPSVTGLINLPNAFYPNGNENDQLLTNNNERMSATELLRLNPFTRLPNTLIDPTAPLLQPTFQFPPVPTISNGVTTTAISTTSTLNFQFMPHLMNTFP